MNKCLNLCAMAWILLYPLSSHADPIAAGYGCTQLGASQMADDKSSLVTCLQISPVETTLIWKSMTGGGVPIGAIVAWPLAGNPPDMYYWLDCDGRSITKADYPILFNMVGNHVPNLQGLFLRGAGAQNYTQENGTTVGKTSTTYASGSLGLVQGDAIRNFSGTSSAFATYMQAGSSGALTSIIETSWAAQTGPTGTSALRVYLNPSLVTPTANEIRPVNMAVRYLIRARN